MFVHYRTQGFILKKEDRGEANQLFTVYTRDFGKLEILGKTIRKISSKLRSGAEIFYLSEIEFIQGKRHKTLTDSIVIGKFSNLKEDLKKLAVAYQVSQTLDDLVSGQEADERIWQLLRETFANLNDSQLRVNELQLIYYYFFWNLISLLGYRPEIIDCTVQEKKINCDTAKIIKIILKKDWQTLTKLKITPNHLKLLKNTSRWYKVKVCG